MKLKRKQTLLGILKTIAYFAGYPLMVLFVAIGSVPFMKEGAFSGTWYLGIVIALIPWLVGAILQIAFGCVTQNQYFKTLVVGIVSTVCMLGCALALDFNGKQVMADMNERYVATQTKDADGNTVVTAKTITVPTYRMGADGKVGTATWTMSSTAVTFETIDFLKGHYLTLTPGYGSVTESYLSELGNFQRIYNVSLYGENKKVTADGKSVTNTDLSLATIDPATGIPFNKNGVVSESYVYSVDFALNVLINYYEAVNKFATLNVDMTPYVAKIEVEQPMADDETPNDYKARVAAMSHEEKLETDAQYRARIAAMTPQEKLEAVYKAELKRVKESEEYRTYQTSDEYVAAYGENGTAKGYMLTVERVKEILPVLVKYVTFVLKRSQVVSDLYDMVNGLLSLEKLNETLAKENYTLQDVVDWFNDEVKGGLVAFIPEETLDGIAALITEENLQALLEDYVYYYSPSVRTAFDFFGEAKDAGGNLIGNFEKETGVGEDAKTLTFTAEEMRTFAYARYYAKTNGAFIGSVLVGNNDDGLGALLNADGNIGQITMSTSGYPASHAFTMDQIYQLKADKEYIPSLFPALAARRYLYIFMGIVLLSIVLFYQFANRENEVIASLVVNNVKGGAK
ncbi:MAG: hypothetical protein II896_03630 [Clostridia bacterium]|nr:hypothetical protein [Clostridia bacterium]